MEDSEVFSGISIGTILGCEFGLQNRFLRQIVQCEISTPIIYGHKYGDPRNFSCKISYSIGL